jgi:hypothetical protein
MAKLTEQPCGRIVRRRFRPVRAQTEAHQRVNGSKFHGGIIRPNIMSKDDKLCGRTAMSWLHSRFALAKWRPRAQMTAQIRRPGIGR